MIWAQLMLSILAVVLSFMQHIVMPHQETSFEVKLNSFLYEETNKKRTTFFLFFSLSYERNRLGEDRRKGYQWLYVSISWSWNNEFLNSSIWLIVHRKRNRLWIPKQNYCYLLYFFFFFFFPFLFQSRDVNKTNRNLSICLNLNSMFLLAKR